MDNLKTSIHSVLDDNLSTPFDYTKIYGLEYCAEEIIKLLTPKLQWKSEEIRNEGGDNLLYIIHYILNYDTETTIKVYEYTDGTNCVDWGNSTLFWGTVEECKKYCSDKILNDFLKLCEL